MIKRLAALLVVVAMLVSVLCSCNAESGLGGADEIESLEIAGEDDINLQVGQTRVLLVDVPESVKAELKWSVSGDAVTVDNRGVVIAVEAGVATVTVSYGELSDSVKITVEAEHTHEFIDGACECGAIDPEYVAPDEPEHEHRFVDGVCECGETEADYEPPFGAEYPSISVSEALALAEKYTSDASVEKVYIVVTIRSIESASNGRMYVYDETGEIYVYKSTYFDGSKISATDISAGDRVVIQGTLRNYNGTLEIQTGTIVLWDGADNDGGSTDADDPYAGMSASEFYADYKPAESYKDSYYRSLHNFMSGSLTVPDAAPEIAENRPMSGGKYIKNTTTVFLDDGNTYVVYDAMGVEVFRVYRGGAYITLEEVAAHMYAFGVLPANHSSSKSTSPASSPWGEYLRVNHTKFSGDTGRYPYEPELPDISGCGGSKTYYEMDIGTTGTDTGSGYAVRIYNNGSSIVRGAARIVYTWSDGNRNGQIDASLGEVYVFYTYNHYNDFQEYLNYFGGWGEMFGNITGGGTLSSNSDYNPTPYVPVAFGAVSGADAVEVALIFVPLWESKRQI